MAEVGDVVVGRVVEIAAWRWKMDLNARGNAQLLLSAVNLPGGVQRRRNAEDELNMRGFFKEGDLVSAEVQELRHDGGIALHTRSTTHSMRCCKLERGQLVTVQPSLIERAKKHFHELPCGVHAILGNNGYVFLSVLAANDGSATEGPDAAALRRAELDVNGRRVLRVSSTCASPEFDCCPGYELFGNQSWHCHGSLFNRGGSSAMAETAV